MNIVLVDNIISKKKNVKKDAMRKLKCNGYYYYINIYTRVQVFFHVFFFTLMILYKYDLYVLHV